MLAVHKSIIKTENLPLVLFFLLLITKSASHLNRVEMPGTAELLESSFGLLLAEVPHLKMKTPHLSHSKCQPTLWPTIPPLQDKSLRAQFQAFDSPDLSLLDKTRVWLEGPLQTPIRMGVRKTVGKLSLKFIFIPLLYLHHMLLLLVSPLFCNYTFPPNWF